MARAPRVFSFLLLCWISVPGGGLLHAAQRPGEERLRASVAAVVDGKDPEPVKQVGVEWAGALPAGAATSTLVLVEGRGPVSNGRSVVEWRARPAPDAGLFVRAGTFFLKPLRLEARTAGVGRPAVMSRGLHAELSGSGGTVGAFRGTFLTEEGGRLRRTRAGSEKILDAYASRPFGGLVLAVEADRIEPDSGSAPPGTGTVHQLRPAASWDAGKDTRIGGEFSATDAGRPSFHVAVEHEGARIQARSAYIRRRGDYVAYGRSSEEREGPVAEVAVEAAPWLGLGGSLARFRSNVDRADRPTVYRSHGTLSVSFRLPANFRAVLDRRWTGARSTDGAGRRDWSRVDAAVLSYAHRMWSGQFRADHARDQSGRGLRGLEVEGKRAFENPLSLSGRLRWETAAGETAPARMAARLQASYRVGPASIHFQRDLTRDVRGGRARATRSASEASAAIRLSAASEVRFEYRRSGAGPDALYVQVAADLTD